MSDKKEQRSIPATKIKRAARFVRTGAKVGRNYASHYTKKLFNRKYKTNVITDRSDIVHPVSVWKALLVGYVFAKFFNTPVEVPDVWNCFLYHFTIKMEYNP